VGVDVGAGEIVGADVKLGPGVGVALLVRSVVPPQAASTQPMTNNRSSLLAVGRLRHLWEGTAVGSIGLRTPVWRRVPRAHPRHRCEE